MSDNQLGEETSPYLLQHKDNPVHWRAWGPKALAEARAANKPILLSVGYAACHWCHVMAHESFENPGIAKLMNDNFVCVKVDREERPDIDQIYQAALAAMGSQGGWPLTMFLSPDGRPFWGGTYYPPEPRFGRPGFPQVLADVARLYREEPERVAKNSEAVRERLNSVWAAQQKRPLSASYLELAARRTAQSIDIFNGGLDGSPKFPQVALLELLWRGFLRTGLQPMAQAVVNSLDHICQGGIYDHLGGGFARYAVDEYWMVPHFEKMLYDNALLLGLLTQVWAFGRSPLYKTRIDETVDWLLREMRVEGAAFASSYDADSEGEEGKFYLWTEAEIDAVLGADKSAIFKQVYGVSPAGNWEGKNVLHRLRAMNYLQPDQEALLAGQRRKLFKAREERAKPARDDKVLADWNALLIAALSEAAAVFQQPEWHVAAVKAFWFVAEKMTAGDKTHRLHHAWRGGRAAQTGLAEDYANMARAALQLFEVTNDPRYLERAKNWTKALDDFFWDGENGGYFATASDAEALIHRVKSCQDSAVPNANGTMLGVLARLYRLTGEQKYRKRGEELVQAFASEAERNFLSTPSFLNGFETFYGTIEFAIIARNDPEAASFLDVIYSKSVPTKLISRYKPDQELPESHPARGKAMVDGKPTLYLCAGETCSAPVTDAASLDRLLLRFGTTRAVA